jgi:hypothetical protein
MEERVAIVALDYRINRIGGLTGFRRLEGKDMD